MGCRRGPRTKSNVPLNIIALSTLPCHILTQGTAIRSLMRNLGGSVGISILVATLAENTQAVHSRLVERLQSSPLAIGVAARTPPMPYRLPKLY
jgi:hypothetical protein